MIQSASVCFSALLVQWEQMLLGIVIKETHMHEDHLKEGLTFGKCLLSISKCIIKFSIDASFLCIFDSYLWLLDPTRSSQVSLDSF